MVWSLRGPRPLAACASTSSTLIAEKGFDTSLVAELVARFDQETDCKCWERVKHRR